MSHSTQLTIIHPIEGGAVTLSIALVLSVMFCGTPAAHAGQQLASNKGSALHQIGRLRFTGTFRYKIAPSPQPLHLPPANEAVSGPIAAPAKTVAPPTARTAESLPGRGQREAQPTLTPPSKATASETADATPISPAAIAPEHGVAAAPRNPVEADDQSREVEVAGTRAASSVNSPATESIDPPNDTVTIAAAPLEMEPERQDEKQPALSAAPLAETKVRDRQNAELPTVVATAPPLEPTLRTQVTTNVTVATTNEIANAAVEQAPSPEVPQAMPTTDTAATLAQPTSPQPNTAAPDIAAERETDTVTPDARLPKVQSIAVSTPPHFARNRSALGAGVNIAHREASSTGTRQAIAPAASDNLHPIHTAIPPSQPTSQEPQSVMLIVSSIRKPQTLQPQLQPLTSPPPAKTIDGTDADDEPPLPAAYLRPKDDQPGEPDKDATSRRSTKSTRSNRSRKAAYLTTKSAKPSNGGSSGTVFSGPTWAGNLFNTTN